MHTKEEALKTQIKEKFSNPRRFWRKLNDIIENSKQSRGFTSIRNDEKIKLENQQAADYMNEYFANIGEKLNANNNSQWYAHNYFVDITNKFSFTVVTSEIVSKYLKTINISKPSGIQYVNNRVLCDALLCIPFEIIALLNNSIIEEVFPVKWKNGVITPIPKPGDLSNKTNWRPITILNTVGKLLEKIVHYQTSLYLNLNELLDDNQHGFRRNFSTSSAIFEYLKDIYESLRTKNIMGCVFIDYQKAFDTINHEILLSKLFRYGFSKNCVNWLRSYLTGRTQSTKCNIYTKPIKDGVRGRVSTRAASPIST